MPDNSLFASEGSLERLSQDIQRGVVVFFVGAGFSLDSEGNTASRLIQRLLVRFLALAKQARAVGNNEFAELSSSLLEKLLTTFHLASKQNGLKRLASKAVRESVAELTRDYYLINDWFCWAFMSLLTELETVGSGNLGSRKVSRYLKKVAKSEKRARARLGDPAEPPEIDLES